ncbi:glycerate kinase [Rhodocytophaga aerolata]|uniref:Glycerate kinase n=1 Tax=Rhodocytophaga aerolata TaxID=455078 RepID=A0ABT8RJI4_9BACT|nr:glycerate kinase [Rhodocytophaga aerolata]MDO1450927.1 glycerate kinase [Rhodocytophaga aerolata]
MTSPVDYKLSATRIFLEAVAAVHPYSLITQSIRLTETHLTVGDQLLEIAEIGHIYVIGAGKATAAMAKAVEDVLGNRIAGGVIVVKYGHTMPLKYISIIEAAHPIPDQNGVEGTKRMLQLLATISPRDLVIALFSGGGSALLTDMPPGCTLEDMQLCFDLLLRSGASIKEINTIRKHLSAVKGGQLAKAVYPARLVSLLLSDVIGDPVDVIASGPTVADPSTFADAWQVIEKYNLQQHISTNITLHLQRGLEKQIPDTPKPADPLFLQMNTKVIGSNAIALQAAGKTAESMGFTTKIGRADIQGDAPQAAYALVEEARTIAADITIPKPVCLLTGGETTVVVTGNGKGGRNQHFALCAALQLAPGEKIVILSAGTDGTDGPTDAAGAVVDGFTVSNAAQMDLAAADYVSRHDSYDFFRQAGGHITTGPTMTNVMDIMLAIIY